MDTPREIPARRGFSICYGGKTLLSRIDPVAQAERLAAGFSLKERTLYFCPSPLYGYGLSLFLERLRNEFPLKNSAVLCVEADGQLFEISRNALEKAGIEGINVPDENSDLLAAAAENRAAPPPNEPRLLALVKASDPESICAFVRKTWGERRFRRVEEIRLGGGWQLFPQLYESMVHALRREMEIEWGNAMTLIRLGRLYARNFIRNLYFLSESKQINALSYGSRPVLVLGAGPSLDPLLDEFAVRSGGKIPGSDQRNYKIICVDTCLPALRERGILPDLAVILESQHWNLRDFTGERGRKTDMAIDCSALPASGRVLGGKRYCFFTPWTELALFGRLRDSGLLSESFPPLGSVGLSAVALALRISSGPVISGGIDFSYTVDAYHARSTPGYISMETGQNRMRSIINSGAAFREGSFGALSKSGESVRSDPAMRNYRNLFEQEFGGKSRVADIAGPGLPLGVRTLSPAEAFAILTGADANDAISHNEISHDAASHGAHNAASGDPAETAARLGGFIRRETAALQMLLDMLTGVIPAEAARLEEALDAADYLWAHFPDCAGKGGQGAGARRPPCTDLGFLRRVRTEIEPFLSCWEMALAELKSARD